MKREVFMGEAEKKIYDLLVASGNVPAVPWEKCQKIEDMFNAIVPVGTIRYAALKLGKKFILINTGLGAQDIFEMLSVIFTFAAPTGDAN